MHLADPLSLRLFLAVCECGTIARAAEREFIAPSALSKRVADLEEQLGVALLSRGQRGVSPTAAGEALIEHARPILRSLQRLNAEVGEHADGVRGHVRVLGIRSALVDDFKNDLADFLVRHRHVGITLNEGVSSDVIRGVMNGSAEIGICRDFVQSRELRGYPFGDDALGVIVARDHPLASRDTVDFDETFAYAQVSTNQGASHRKATDRAARELGVTLNYRFNVFDPVLALRLIAEGLCIGVFPTAPFAGVEDRHGVRIVPLSDRWARRPMYLCVSALEPLSPAAKKLMQCLLARHRGVDAGEPL